MEISGIILRGAGKGAFFTQIDWVVSQCEYNLGFKPFPGTLNVRINNRDIAGLDRFLEPADFELVPDNPDFCTARVKKILLNGVVSAVVIPDEDVRIHENRVLEVISSCGLKQKLGLHDGDPVRLSWPESKGSHGIRVSGNKGQQTGMKMAVYRFSAFLGRAFEDYLHPQKHKLGPGRECGNRITIPETNILSPMKLFR